MPVIFCLSHYFFALLETHKHTKHMDEQEKRSREIIFSKAVKAGKRIYYMDVKSSRTGDMYLSITESKKVTSGDADSPTVNFEKHKIFLYKEDFEKFLENLHEAVDFIEDHQGKAEPREEIGSEEIKIDLDI